MERKKSSDKNYLANKKKDQKDTEVFINEFSPRRQSFLSPIPSLSIISPNDANYNNTALRNVLNSHNVRIRSSPHVIDQSNGV